MLKLDLPYDLIKPFHGMCPRNWTACAMDPVQLSALIFTPVTATREQKSHDGTSDNNNGRPKQRQSQVTHQHTHTYMKML